MRVLLTTRGSSGHVGPLAPFGRACVHAGHEVLVAAQRANQANVERAGLPFAPVEAPRDSEWMPLLEKFSGSSVDAANDQMIAEFFGRLDTRAALPGLRAIAERWRPDVILRESWEFGSTLIAELYEIPLARVGLGLATVEELTIGLAAPAVDEARRAAGLPGDPSGERMRAAPYLTVLPAALEDPAAPLPQETHRFRPRAPGAETPLPDWWEGSEAPLVYLTFGSVTAGTHLPYYPALYRKAIAELADLPVRVLVTIGDASRDLGELGSLPGNVHAEHWVPQDTVAARAAVIACHGGYGSTIGALVHGTPLVVLPLFSTDQWANAAAVARAGAGVALDADRATRSSLELPGPDTVGGLAAAVQRVLDDPAYATEARRVASELRAQAPLEEAVGLLARLAGR